MRPLSVYRHHIKEYIKHIFLICLASALCMQLSAQSRSELERQRKQKEQEIALTKKLLAETNEKQKKTLEYLSVLNQQIKSRQELIGTLQNELHLIDLGIAQESDVVNALESDLTALKQEYARLMYFMYKNRNSNNMLSFIFASHSFNEAVKRFKFIQFYTAYRKKQMELIQRTEESLRNKIADLKQKQLEKTIVLTNLNTQKQNLEADKQDQSQVVEQLQGQENKLIKQLKEKQRIAAQLDKAIHDIIAREMAANKKKGSAGTSGAGKTEKFSLTPEAQKLGQEFASNKAKLPWPVERGYISERFGQHEHPNLPHVMVNCNGIRIRTTKGARARAIFNGEVSKVVKLGENNYAVLINHGTYYTVYANLSEVFVQEGDKVASKEDIGVVAQNIDNGQTEIELQVWQGAEKLNPEGWLYNR